VSANTCAVCSYVAIKRTGIGFSSDGCEEEEDEEEEEEDEGVEEKSHPTIVPAKSTVKNTLTPNTNFLNFRTINPTFLFYRKALLPFYHFLCISSTFFASFFPFFAREDTMARGL
jgi:hypothetical protein